MNKRFITIVILIVLAALARLLPHAPNFAPVGAIALFAGAYISKRYLAFLVPVLAMILSDALMGFNGWFYATQTISVYAAFLLITALGLTMQKNKSIFRVGGMSLTASVLFFVVTNLFVWFEGFFHQPALYPLDFSGIIQCYTLAVPFFDKTVAADLFYNAVLFGGFYLLQINIPSLKQEKVRV